MSNCANDLDGATVTAPFYSTIKQQITFHEDRKFTSARHSAFAESSIYQPPAIGTYIAESKRCSSDDVK